MSLISSRRSSPTSMTPKQREKPFLRSHSPSSISALDRDSLRRPLEATKLKFSTRPKVPMLTMDSSNKQKSSTVDSISSSCLTLLPRVLSSQLISTLRKTPRSSLKKRSSTSHMLSATITTTGQTPLRSLPRACWLTRSPSIAVKSASFLQMSICTSFLSISEEVEEG